MSDITKGWTGLPPAEPCTDATADATGIARDRLSAALSRYLSVPPGSALVQLAQLAVLVLEGRQPNAAGGAGIEPSLVLEILASPEGRAAIAECMRRPPVRMPDGTWREPRSGAEAEPGNHVRYLDGTDCGEVFDIDPDGGLWIRSELSRFSVARSEVEVVGP